VRELSEDNIRTPFREAILLILVPSPLGRRATRYVGSGDVWSGGRNLHWWMLFQMYKYKCRVRGDKVRGNTGYREQEMIRCKAWDEECVVQS